MVENDIQTELSEKIKSWAESEINKNIKNRLASIEVILDLEENRRARFKKVAFFEGADDFTDVYYNNGTLEGVLMFSYRINYIHDSLDYSKFDINIEYK